MVYGLIISYTILVVSPLHYYHFFAKKLAANNTKCKNLNCPHHTLPLISCFVFTVVQQKKSDASTKSQHKQVSEGHVWRSYKGHLKGHLLRRSCMKAICEGHVWGSCVKVMCEGHAVVMWTLCIEICMELIGQWLY